MRGRGELAVALRATADGYRLLGVRGLQTSELTSIAQSLFQSVVPHDINYAN